MIQRRTVLKALALLPGLGALRALGKRQRRSGGVLW